MKTTAKSIFDPKYKRLVAGIVAARKKKGWSQRELAEKASVSQNFIARTEIRERRLDVTEAINLMKVLGMSKAEIIKRLSELV